MRGPWSVTAVVLVLEGACRQPHGAAAEVDAGAGALAVATSVRTPASS